jgi:hypothetical protein
MTQLLYYRILIALYARKIVVCSFVETLKVVSAYRNEPATYHYVKAFYKTNVGIASMS